jgi:hypothetical protein
MNWTATIERYLAEGRTVSGGKGDPEIKAQEQQQAGFNKQLASVFQTQFGNQAGILNFLNQKLTGQIQNPTGLDPEARAALSTSNTENAAKDFAHAQQATQSIEAGRGGSSLPSGVSAQLTGANANAAAAAKAAGESQIALTDANLKNQNYWNAVGGETNVAQMENPSGFGSLYNGGSSNVGSLGEAYNQTQQSQLAATLGGLGGGAISAVGSYYGRNR